MAAGSVALIRELIPCFLKGQRWLLLNPAVVGVSNVEVLLEIWGEKLKEVGGGFKFSGRRNQ